MPVMCGKKQRTKKQTLDDEFHVFGHTSAVFELPVSLH